MNLVAIKPSKDAMYAHNTEMRIESSNAVLEVIVGSHVFKRNKKTNSELYVDWDDMNVILQKAWTEWVGSSSVSVVVTQQKHRLSTQKRGRWECPWKRNIDLGQLLEATAAETIKPNALAQAGPCGINCCKLSAT